MSGYRLPYTSAEEGKILDYIIQYDMFYCLKGDLVWKKMEKDLDMNRTWQSLKNHFKKKMINNLHYYDLDKTVLEKFLQGKLSGRPRRKSQKTDTIVVDNNRKIVDLNAISSGSETE